MNDHRNKHIRKAVDYALERGWTLRLAGPRAHMTKYEFTLILAGDIELTDDLADRLYEAGCDDGSPGMCEGIVSIDFHREANSLESAIRSAIAQVTAAGCTVSRVEMDAGAVALKT